MALKGNCKRSPHVRESGIRNPANFCCWNPESRDWNPESTMVWNPESTALVWNLESRRLESGIQRAGIQNPYAGIRNLDAGIRNPGPSWILLHGAKKAFQGVLVHGYYPTGRTTHCSLNIHLASSSKSAIVAGKISTNYNKYTVISIMTNFKI